MIDAPVVDLTSLAKNLLDTIKSHLWTEHSEKCRIIFVAHSHGGLVVKRALVDDFRASRTNSGIASQTDGVLFFGTPHKGSEIARLGQLVSRFLGAWGSDPELLGHLVQGSRSLWPLQNEFTNVLDTRLAEGRPIYVWNFYEEQKTTVFDFGHGIKKTSLVSVPISFHG
jgi:hypothetical protein